MSWQVYWHKWHFSYDQNYSGDGLWSNWLFIGPLQFHWYSS